MIWGEKKVRKEFEIILRRESGIEPQKKKKVLDRLQKCGGEIRVLERKSIRELAGTTLGLLSSTTLFHYNPCVSIHGQCFGNNQCACFRSSAT